MIIFTIYINTSSLAGPMAVQAEFVKEITIPGANSVIKRPSNLYFDKNFNELFILEPNKNRVLIFDSLGSFRFEFNGKNHFSSPIDVTVDSDGYIYILGNQNQIPIILKYDFDGLFINQVTLSGDENIKTDYIKNFDIDSENNFYLFDEFKKQVIVTNSQGEIQNSFPVLEDVDKNIQNESIYGSIYISGDLLYIPIANLGTVRVFSLSGDFVNSLGYFGTLPGELNFPISVAVTDDGMALVLDKLRFCVVCFDKNGVFIGEFGGMGYRSGWFYHPTLLTIDGSGNAYIGQIYDNRIQKCKIPESIQQRFSKNNSIEINKEILPEPKLSANFEYKNNKADNVRAKINKGHYDQ